MCQTRIMEIHQQIALGSTEVANLIELHQDLMQDNDEICEVVNLGRHSLEFFIASGKSSHLHSFQKNSTA